MEMSQTKRGLSVRRAVLALAALLTAFVFLSSVPAEDLATVVRVVDGDTLEISLGGRQEKVRLIGVDTPEVHESEKLHRDAARTRQDEATIRALGKRASNFTKSLVRAGDQVRLEYDQQQRDRYRRLLAFVWLADGRLLNEVIICEGYANAYTRYPFKQEYMDRFRACERQAREQGKGLWKEEGSQRTAGSANEHLSASASQGEIRGNKRSMLYHLPGCPSYNRISPANVIAFRSEEEAIRAGYKKAGNCR
jgi:micrococcal nuclease